MALDQEAIKKLGRLSRIALTQEDLETVQSPLNAMMGLIDQLSLAQVDAVEPLTHPTIHLNGLDHHAVRPDDVTSELARDALMAPAPLVQDGYFLVPRVLD